jgi:hypothetical protein
MNPMQPLQRPYVKSLKVNAMHKQKECLFSPNNVHIHNSQHTSKHLLGVYHPTPTLLGKYLTYKYWILLHFLHFLVYVLTFPKS